MEVYTQRPGHGSGRGKFNLNLHQLSSPGCYSGSGFSLIELLTTISVFAILATVAVPSISNLVNRERTTVFINEIAGHHAYARSSAVSTGNYTVICQSSDGEQCTGTANWHMGWIIFHDDNRNEQFEPPETLIRVVRAPGNGIQAHFNGGWNNDHFVRYRSDGSAFPNGSFTVCHPGSGKGKALILSRTGRLRISQTTTSNQRVTC